MDPLEVADKRSMRHILETFGQLDDIRWKDASNYNLINYCADDLTADEKLLTHYLCYIMDRQTAFERIWDVGGYVISHLVRAYTRDVRDVRQLLQAYLVRWEEDGKVKVGLQCDLQGENEALARYQITRSPVKFRSRFMPQDLVLIFRTLALLDGVSHRSLGRFMARTVKAGGDRSESISTLAVALYGLTYGASSRVSAETLDENIDSMAERVSEEAEAFAEDLMRELERWRKRFHRFEQKRLWCSLRDYLKSPEFNDHFVEALQAAGFCAASSWHRDNPSLRDALDALELPGDLWNNSPVFREGLFEPYVSNLHKDMPRTVREIHDTLAAEGQLAFYPEQLDVTFDFVPRMCERRMCDVCLFGDGIESLCHQRAGFLCPVVLLACGYRHNCEPADCLFKENLVKGLCTSRTGYQWDTNSQGKRE